MAAVRQLYQRAVTVPHAHLDGMWRDYQRFENDGPNKQFAKKVRRSRVADKLRSVRTDMFLLPMGVPHSD